MGPCSGGSSVKFVFANTYPGSDIILQIIYMYIRKCMYMCVCVC